VTVLVVDDDVSIVGLMRDYLEAQNFIVESAFEAEEALAILGRARVDCLLLDVMLPGLSGFDLCRHVRETSEMPILFLSARDSDIDKIRGLGIGGDDYIVKSATPSEVVARVQAVLRRSRATSQFPPPPNVPLDFGRLLVDLSAHQVRIDEYPIPLTAKEFELLRFLAEHPHQVFTRDQLFERFWGEFGDRHTVTVHIGRIRDKLGMGLTLPNYIATVRGVGYRFEGIRT